MARRSDTPAPRPAPPARGDPARFDAGHRVHAARVEEVVNDGRVILAKVEDLGLKFFNRRRDGRYILAGDTFGALDVGPAPRAD